jgi:hypothetical protein
MHVINTPVLIGVLFSSAAQDLFVSVFALLFYLCSLLMGISYVASFQFLFVKFTFPHIATFHC